MEDSTTCELMGTIKVLAKQLQKACIEPLTVCPVRGRMRQEFYETHGLNLPKKCPFFFVHCSEATSEGWVSQLIQADARRMVCKV